MKKLILSLIACGTMMCAANSAVVGGYWDVPASDGSFSFTVDTDANTLSWDTANLWVDRDAAGDNIQFVPSPLDFEYVVTYIVWPDVSNGFMALRYDSETGNFQVPNPQSTRTVFLTDEQVTALQANSVSFTLDPSMSNDDLTGLLVVADVPEPASLAFMFGIGLLGFAVYRKNR